MNGASDRRLHFIAALRAKIEPDPATQHHLITVRGEGYRLEISPPVHG